MPAVLPTSAEMISATQTAEQQRVDLAATMDYLAERLCEFTTTGTAVAFVGVPVPAITAYFPLSCRIVTHVAAGLNPTAQLSGLPVPPNLVYKLGDGSYANINGNMPAGVYRATAVSATQLLVHDLPSTAGSVPAGSVIWHAANTAPAGYLKANGALVSRATYAVLFAAIGATFGSGDGLTTFALPDLRGQFVRGWDDARGVDAARVLGSSQADQLLVHGHPITDAGHAHSITDAGHSHVISDPGHAHAMFGGNVGRVLAPGIAGGGNFGAGPASTIDATNTANAGTGVTVASGATGIAVTGAGTGITVGNSSGAAEVRVKNVALLACIKT